jgi:hypothetical protein
MSIKSVLCSLLPQGQPKLMEQYPEGILVWSQGVDLVQRLAEEIPSSWVCETVDPGFYNIEDCHVRLYSDRTEYRAGFSPSWKE